MKAPCEKCSTPLRLGSDVCEVCRTCREGARERVLCPRCGFANHVAEAICVQCDNPLRRTRSAIWAGQHAVRGGRTLGWFSGHLREWVDFDEASCALAESLGLVEISDRGHPHPHKGVFWSANPVGDGLARILRQLVEMGVLEENEDRQYRVRAGFEFDGFRKTEEDVTPRRRS